MNTDFLLRKLYLRVATVGGGPSAQSSWTRTTELLVAGITVPTLVVLVAWQGSAHGLSPMWSQGLATILGLALAYLAMRKSTVFLTSPKNDDIPFTAPTRLAPDAPRSSVTPDLHGWYGQMVNLTSDELEFLSELVAEYLEDNDDLNHAEFGFVKVVLDKIDEALND